MQSSLNNIRAQAFEKVWPDSRDAVSLTELSGVCGMSTADLTELVDYGALAPLESNAQGRVFGCGCIAQLRTLGQLRLDFDLDVFTVAVLMGYLSRIDELERQVLSLQVAAHDRRGQTQYCEGHAP